MGLWRTPKRHEMHYLLNTRTGASSKRGFGNIQLSDGENVNGLILLPDNWTLPEGCTFNFYSGNSNYRFSNNTYTIDQWELMENAGAVFLPAAGVCNTNTGVTGVVGTRGYYWSSTHDNYSVTNYYLYAWNLCFYENYMNYNNSTNRNTGSSVRLVIDNN